MKGVVPVKDQTSGPAGSGTAAFLLHVVDKP